VPSKNFVWLTLDSVRGDRTSVGGHDRPTTPTLAAIGDRPDGVAGTCFSHAVWSQPSVASILTGTYPSTHGAGSHNETLPEAIPTVAERLSRAGYRTVGVSSNAYCSPATGADRGFDRFDFLSGARLARAAGPTGLLGFLRNLRTFSGGFTLERRKHSSNFLLNQVVKDRLRSAAGRDEPFFLLAHYSGAHHPYYPSPAFRNAFADDLPMSPDAAVETAFDRSTDVYERIAEGGLDPAARDAVRAMYDAQVAQADALVGRLLSFLDRLGIDDETIVVVTADHGDLLGELGLFSHKLLLHDALIEVPVAVRGSEALAGADLGLAQHADVVETILAELGVDTGGMQGLRLDESAREAAVAQRGPETYETTMAEVRSHDPGFDHDHALAGFVTAYRTADWKYVSGDGEAVLYDLPAENEDVAAAHPAVADRLRARLDAWLDEYDDPVLSEAEAEFDPDVRDRLADLGYAEQ